MRDEDTRRNGNDDDYNNDSTVISIPSTSFYSTGSGVHQNNQNNSRDRTTLTEVSSPFLFKRPTAPVPPASAKPTARVLTQEEEEDQELYNLIHNQNTSHQRENHHLSPTSATTLNSLRDRHDNRHSPSSSSIRYQNIDDLESQILLQELRDWKGEGGAGGGNSSSNYQNQKMVSRPDGYNKMFSASEYSSL